MDMFLFSIKLLILVKISFTVIEILIFNKWSGTFHGVDFDVSIDAIFGPYPLWPNGWMDRDGTWQGGGP